MTSFSNRLGAALAAKRHLCVGIDPHAPLLADWGLTDDAAGAERMGRDVIAAAAGVAACVKPQIAFFERFGSAGYVALERVLADARAAGVLVIADVKRGDIGSSFAAYADAWLTPGSPLEADAMTVTAYQGFGSLSGAFGHVRDHGKGLFVLAATSNPEAREVQQSRRADGRTVAQAMVDDALAFDAPLDTHVNSVGVVLGATLTLADFGIDVTLPPAKPALPVLAPGFGHQGARIEDAGRTFGGLGWALLANESRSVLSGGARGLADRVRERSDSIARALTPESA
ncbi:orotidine-5'-phosphate decarboxylase [Leucobacter rhizosphaerae]|uniref:Orotidine-5'-phosphate decarboxylase n=1 Tax=Leucobacter rhizosphaerae TaxID=2932245 RepID=A0ABY4FX36_9MICO|nr:orotidine-5'-phosphate decarboxylase [Leucobacter rhizosphaerae]UOQ60827.1 orotidine-5'-phosphate decarboxylase [Leucobacter rhizosphaerae]